MKHKIIKLISGLTLGTFLALGVSPGINSVSIVKADDSNSVSFTSFADKGSSSGGSGSSISYTMNDVTVSTSGGYATNGVLRVYSGKKLTISSKNYKIGTIDFVMDESDSKKYFDSTLAEGVKDVNNLTWSYTTSKQTRFKTITITFATSDATVTSLEVDQASAPKTLEVGKAISYTGLKVNGVYSNNEKYNVADKCEFSPAEGTILSEVGPKVVTVTYKASNTPTTTSGEDINTTFTVSVTQGEKPTVFTEATSVAPGDQIIFVSGTKAAKSSLTSADVAYKHYLDTTDVSVVDDKVNVLSTDDVGVYTVEEGVLNNTYAFINALGKYLSTYSIDRDGLKFVDEKDEASSWTVNLLAGSNKIKSNIANQAADSSVYLKYNVNTFRAYKSTSLVAEPSIYKYSSGAEKISVQGTAKVLEESTISLVSEVVGFTPSSYSWTVQDSNIVEIVGSSTSSSVQIKGLVPGSTNVTVKANNSDDLVATCVVTVIAKKDALIENGEYFITDFSGTHLLNTDLEDIGTPDYTDTTKLWTVTNTGKDGDTYSISNGSNYLFHNPSIKNSSLDLSSDNSKYWVATKNDDNSFTFAYSETGNTLSCNPGASTGTWFAYAGATGTQDHVKLLKVGNFERFEIEKLPTTKQYFVGDALKPLNSKVNAVFDNGAKVDVTSKIVWEPLTAGTKAYGKITIGGQERTVEMDGIKVYKGDASTFIVEGLQDSYPIGEKINKDFLIASITYKLAGEDDIEKVLTKNDYVISPEKIEEGTTKITVSLAKDPTVFIEKEITIKENVYVAAPHVYEGDTIVIGTLGYNPYELTGGYEVAHNGTKFTYEPFGSLPRGQMQFNVGKQDGYYTLQDVASGYYLKGDNSSLGFHMPDTKSVYAESDGHYEFNVNVNIGGITQLVTMKTELNPDFSYTNVFTAMEYVNGYTDYITGISDLENNKLKFELYTKASNYEVPVTAEVNLSSWSFTNGVFQYAIEASSVLPDECLFTLNYDEDFEEWVVSSKPHQDKQLYFNKDGKFGFYEIGSSYTPIMLFRNNEKPLQSNPTSLSVSFFEGMDEISVGEQFPWTSSLIVKANYSGGASKIIPVGGYQIIQMPDTSKVGKATGKISYGQIGHEIVKEFTITVKGKTQAFDVVCENPILVGETYQAHLADHYEPPVDEPITWSVSDETLASIDQNGNVTGLAPGKVDVIATSFDGTYSDFKNIEIYQQVESVTLNKHEVSLNPGETCALSATVLPSNASNKKVVYTSSDESVAIVSAEGVITAVSQGTATITCEAQNHPEENYDTCVVTVNAAPVVHVNEIRMTPAELSLGVGQSSTLSVEILPNNAADKSVTWSSSNPSVATVSNGRVTGVKEGTTVITCTTNDGGLTATCEVTVTNNYVAVTSVTLNKTQAEIKVGEKVNLVATVGPENATDKTITWTSSNAAVATVNNGEVTAVKAGTAIITAKAGNVTATCEVTVKEDTPVVVHVTSLSLDKTSEEMKVGESIKLNVTVNPSDATDKGVTWSTSDESIAGVTQSGVVVANKEGSVTITVTSNDGGIKATATITVKAEHVNPDPVDPVDPVEPDKPQGIIETIVDSIKNMNDKLLSLVGCKGSVAATSLIVSIASLTGAALVIARKKKDDK